MERNRLCILFTNFERELRSYLKLLTFSWGITNLTSKQPDSPTPSIPVELRQYRRSVKDTIISAKGDNCAIDCLDLGIINKHCQRHYRSRCWPTRSDKLFFDSIRYEGFFLDTITIQYKGLKKDLLFKKFSANFQNFWNFWRIVGIFGVFSEFSEFSERSENFRRKKTKYHWFWEYRDTRYWRFDTIYSSICWKSRYIGIR